MQILSDKSKREDYDESRKRIHNKQRYQAQRNMNHSKEFWRKVLTAWNQFRDWQLDESGWSEHIVYFRW